MPELIDWLEGLNAKDTKVRAVLRRSLAFAPGEYPPAFPYVEAFVSDADSSWRRSMLYLVAGLWALNWNAGHGGQPVSLGRACADYKATSGSESVESRFINLLDANSHQLPYRLRQMVALLKDYAIDFKGLLRGLFLWNDERKRTQNALARDFYRSSRVVLENDSAPGEEDNK